MLNCKDLTHLVSESFERKLSIRERLNLWLHISMCGTCRRFRQLQQRIQRALQEMPPQSEERHPNRSTPQLTLAARDRIDATIQSRLQSDLNTPGNGKQPQP